VPEQPESRNRTSGEVLPLCAHARRGSPGEDPHRDARMRASRRDARLERARRELEITACTTVLDLLALALIDRTDVDAIIEASIRANRARRRMKLPSEWPSVAGGCEAGGQPGRFATDRSGAANTLAQSLLRAAELEFVSKRT